MVAETRTMNKFKDEILAGIDEKFNSLKTDILTELKYQIKMSLLKCSKKNLEKKKDSNRHYLCLRSMFIIIDFK